jgi:hypothetical protein
VVCDPAERALPQLVANALRPDGEISLLGVFGGLVMRPMQVAALTRLASDFAEGLRALRRCRELLGLGFGVPARGELGGELLPASAHVAATAGKSSLRGAGRGG